MHTDEANADAKRRDSNAGGPRYVRDRELTLARAIRCWLAETPPKVLVFFTAVALVVRACWGDWSWYDLLPLVVMPLLQPFVEWGIHVFILHHRPTDINGVRLDFHAARHHRAHHRDPWDVRFTIMPLPAMAIGAFASAGAALLVLPTIGSAITAMAVTAVMGTAYEWTHYLIHTSYRPRTALYRRLWRLHRLHHFKNEHYWMGVTRHLGDMLLGTFPDKDEVTTSDTARTLGMDGDPTL